MKLWKQSYGQYQWGRNFSAESRYKCVCVCIYIYNGL